MIGKITAIENKIAKNGNRYLKVSIATADGTHTFSLFTDVLIAFEAKHFHEGDWVAFMEVEDKKGYKRLGKIERADPPAMQKQAVQNKADETAERIARTSALKLAVDTYNSGNIPAEQIYEIAEEYKAYILTGAIPEREVVE